METITRIRREPFVENKPIKEFVGEVTVSRNLVGSDVVLLRAAGAANA